MTKQVINVNAPKDLIGVGTSANDRKGDSLRAAFTKVNDAIDKIDANFTELYLATGADIQIPAQATNGGKYLTTDGSVLSWATVTSGTSYDQSLNTTDQVAFDRVIATNYLQTPEYKYTGSISGYGSLPVTVVGGATTVIYSYDNWNTSAKLVIQVEGRLDADLTGVDHTQTCEATVASTYNTAAEPSMSVYGVIYTSVSPLATFTVQRGSGLTAGKIEILATNSQATNNIVVKVQALQFISRYD